MHVKYNARLYQYSLTPSRKNLGKHVARSNRQSIARHCWDDPIIRCHLLKILHTTLRKEIGTMCSDQTNSLLLDQSPDCLLEFKWDQLQSELGMHSPTLNSLLHACFSTRVPRENKAYLVCLCAALMLKNRRPSMSLLHKIVSLILFSGHCSKQVKSDINCDVYTNSYV